MIRQLIVGGITVLIRADNLPCLQPQPDPSYLEFEEKVSVPSPQYDIGVRIDTAGSRSKAVEQCKLLYTSGNSWSFYRTDRKYIIELQPQGFARPMWTAECNEQFTGITVHVQDIPHQDQSSQHSCYPMRYPLDQILLMHYLGLHNGLIVHTAGLEVGGKAYLFPGISGAGKSTISLCLEKDNRFQIINDDRIILRYRHGRFHACGTPWPGEAGTAININRELAGIFFLDKGPQNRIESITPRHAFEKLMPIASIPWQNKTIVPAMLECCEKLVRAVPVCTLSFTPSSDLADYLCEFMS